MFRRGLFPLWTIVAVCLYAAPLWAADVKADKKPTGKAIIPVFRLNAAVTEAPAQESPFDFGVEASVSLRELVARFKKAAADPDVKAVVLLHEEGSIGVPQIEELRQAMTKLRGAGKDIFVHCDSLSMREYALLSGASRISVSPTGDLWVSGMYGEAPYLRGLLDKIGVQPDFLTCGEFKSAAEMFMRKGPSPQAEEMQNWLLDGIYDTQLGLIAKGRNVDKDKAKGWIDAGPYTAEKAKAAGLIDAVEHRQAFEAMLKDKYGKGAKFTRKYGRAKGPDLDFSSPFAMFKIWTDLLTETQKKKSTKSAVGIVYVEGGIALGGGSGSPFGAGGAMSSDIRKALNEAAKNDSIKAVVLRVNSPGGSAVASEIILDATRRVKAKKPFVVSMGNVAGSGGYYVACAADTIFADDSTITGSIGVVAGKLATNKMWNNIGINWKGYRRGAHASMLESGDPFTADERQRMQNWMDDIYGVFKGHVTAIRKDKLKKPIDDLAGGRVYTGRQALELGLVDKIGTLDDAIAFVAAEAKLNDYDVRVVPEPKNFIEQILEEATGGKDDPDRIEVGLRWQPLARKAFIVDLALPYLKQLDPARVQSIRAALEHLELLHHEGVSLLMPEFLIAR